MLTLSKSHDPNIQSTHFSQNNLFIASYVIYINCGALFELPFKASVMMTGNQPCKSLKTSNGDINYEFCILCQVYKFLLDQSWHKTLGKNIFHNRYF